MDIDSTIAPTDLILPLLVAVLVGFFTFNNISKWMAASSSTAQRRPADNHNNGTIPFLTHHEPDWRDITKTAQSYENEINNCLSGLSKSLEACLETEEQLGLSPVLSTAINEKISTLSQLLDQDLTIIRHDLMQEFPLVKMLPNGQAKTSSRADASTADPDPSKSNNHDRPLHRTAPTPKPSSYNSASQIVAHVVRDWTSLGAPIRKNLYDWCSQQLQASATGQRMLVPGAGLGRLAYNLALLGHTVEANEMSLPMAAAARAIFNSGMQQPLTLHPFLLDYFVNEVDSERRYESVVVESPATTVFKKGGSLSFTIGDFVEIYGPALPSSYDTVITCFFLDTATNVLEYIAIITNILVKGGRWINVGPLQWHLNAQLFPSADELKTIIKSFGYSIQHWSIDETPMDYRSSSGGSDGAARSTKLEGYQPLRMVAFKTTNKGHYPVETLRRASEAKKADKVRSPQQQGKSSVKIEEL